jgi:RNA-directed DNA polymerase
MLGNLDYVSTVQQRIATLTQRSSEFAFFSLAHHITLDWLEAAYHRTRKGGAAGIDDVTGANYAENLHENLQSLLDRLKSGMYKAPPVLRKHIPKEAGGETRPIGIPTFEDKIVQRAVVMLLEPIYEHDFYEGSYGFRPGRSAHQALDAVWKATMEMHGGSVLEVDLRKFFDTLDHKHLQEFVSRRVRDGVLRRLIGKWLNAGVMEKGSVSYPDAGSPQGGVISPLLANIYLHYVLDEWFEQEVQPCMQGRCRLIRYADDFVIVFEKESDALRVMEVLPKRFGKYNLTVHPEKTKLVDFRGPNHWQRRREKSSSDGPGRDGRPESFDLLGFTHYWGKTRKGGWAVKRKTIKKRLARAVRNIKLWCRTHRHWPVREQWKKLCAKMKGHYAYYGITGNSASLGMFRFLVIRTWREWLSRRSRERSLNWEKFYRLLRAYPLPNAKVVHSSYVKK